MIEAEETDLPTHVQLCAQRHEAVLSILKQQSEELRELRELLQNAKGGVVVLRWFGFGSLGTIIAIAVAIGAWIGSTR